MWSVFLGSGFEYELGDVFDVLSVWEHVDGLYVADVVGGCEEADVAGLSGGVAADVDDASGLHGEELLDYFFVHAGTRGVGDDNIGTAVECDKFGGEDFGHVAGEESGVANLVVDGVLAGGSNGVFDVFDADDLFAHAGEEERYGAGSGVEVVEGVVRGEAGVLSNEGVETLCLG